MLCTSVPPLMNEPNNREAGRMGGIFNLCLVLHFSLPQVQYGSHGQRYTPVPRVPRVPRVTLISKTRRCRLRELSILVRIQEIMDEPAQFLLDCRLETTEQTSRAFLVGGWRGAIFVSHQFHQFHVEVAEEKTVGCIRSKI